MVGNNGFGFRRLERQYVVVQRDGAVAMMLGRFFMHIPILAIAGNLAKKKLLQLPPGRFP